MASFAEKNLRRKSIKKKLTSETTLRSSINESFGYNPFASFKSIFDNLKWFNDNTVAGNALADNTEFEEIEIRKDMPIIYRKTLDETKCYPFNSTKGRRVFQDAIETKFMNIYFILSPQFHTQSDPNFCGVSTLVMALNSLSVDPRRMWKYPWRWYAEEVLNLCEPLPKIRAQGISFETLTCACTMNGLDTEVVRNSASVEEFRKDVKESCSSDNKVLILNYGRPYFNQSGTGHFTTAGGYSEKDDLILVMDTARFKYPPHWVKLEDMFLAMKEIEVNSHGKTTYLPRGYMIVRKSITDSLVIQLSSKYKLTIRNLKILGIINSWKVWTNNEVMNPSKVIEVSINNVLTMLKHMFNKNNNGDFLSLFLFLNETDSKHLDIYAHVRDILNSPSIFEDKLKTIIIALNSNNTCSKAGDSLNNDNIAIFVTNWILYWPYAEASKESSYSFKLSKIVHTENVLLDAATILQIRFLRNMSEHFEHHRIYKQEEIYLD